MNLSFITVVSGLPRSGTSMMMQVLEAGGVPVLTDNIRKKDEDNPEGYYEFEPVKRTKDDPSWVPAAKGKAVKMVYSLLYDLPTEYVYRVIFMRRNMKEVIASQKVMLERTGRKGAQVSDEKLAELFNIQLKKFDYWIATRKNFSVLSVDYKDMIASQKAECERIHTFLGGILDVDAAMAAVNSSLYRRRT
jgi:hypothetical protein